jgi:Outer membrane protein Omp28
MMKHQILVGMVSAILFCAACKESPIEIPTLTAGKKTVLVEELTGVRCPSCPEGTVELIRLQGIYGKNLIVVSNHSAGTFSVPMTNPPSAFDFRMTDFKDLATFIGSNSGYPTASINRLVFGTEASAFAESRPSWGGYIASETQKDPGMDLFVLPKYNADTRTLEAKVRILPTKEALERLNLTVMITQDSILDAQTVGPVKEAKYVHRHVLRKLLTKFDGDPINEAFVAGTVIERTFTFVLPTSFDANQCSVVAAVHRTGTPDKAILQAAEAHIE